MKSFRAGDAARTQVEYELARERLVRDQEYLGELKKALQAADLSREKVEEGLQPALSFHKKLLEEIDAYGRMRRCQFDELLSLTGIGRWLIGVRIYRTWELESEGAGATTLR